MSSKGIEVKSLIDTASQYRHFFPVFDKVTYINSCSQGALAIPVRDALNEYLDGMYEKGSLWDQWVMKLDELRRLVAEAFSTSSTNVAITTTASAGINSVLSSIDFSGKRNRIVTTDLEFPTMGQILHAQERRGAEIVHVASEPDGTLDLAKLEAALDDRVALVAVTHVCYRNGAMTDIKEVSRLTHKHEIPVLVDAYQSVGSMPIDFDDVGADFLVGGFLKYMLGLPGIGFLLARSDSKLIPTQTGWFAARDIFAMEINQYEPSLDARRFEGGTPPIPSVYGAVAGLKLLLEVGLENAWNHTLAFHKHLREELENIGARVMTPIARLSHGVMVAIQTKDEYALVIGLEQDGIITSSRGGNLRISPHFYNTAKDIEILMSSLQKHRSLLI
jgi:selenocysteine lyase/cysteine desulfurase